MTQELEIGFDAELDQAIRINDNKLSAGTKLGYGDLLLLTGLVTLIRSS